LISNNSSGKNSTYNQGAATGNSTSVIPNISSSSGNFTLGANNSNTSNATTLSPTSSGQNSSEQQNKTGAASEKPISNNNSTTSTEASVEEEPTDPFLEENSNVSF